MINYNSALIKIAQRYVHELCPSGMVACTVNGSVGRRDADQYSDIDLTIYVENSNFIYPEMNIVFEGQIIQTHAGTLPEWKTIEENPWDYRFLTEAISIYDPTSTFAALKSKTIDFFQTKKGLQRLIHRGQQVVQTRKDWASEALKKNELIDAGLAADSAYIDAAFLVMFLEENTCATNNLIPFLQQSDPLFGEYLKLTNLHLESTDIHSMLRILERYRDYLRQHKQKCKDNEFIFSPLQDILVGFKAQRLILKNENINLLWQLRAEAFWMFLFDSNEKQSFDSYITELPNNLQKDLQILGFIHLSEEAVYRLCDLGGLILQRINNYCRD